MLGFESLFRCQKILKANCFQDFFICAARHNIICVAHATSFERQLNIIAARGTNERGCAKSQMMWAIAQRCYAYGVNDVALRANGAVAVCIVRLFEVDF